MEPDNTYRNRIIIKYNIVGIAGNLLLSVLKIVVGLGAHSHAILLDAFNGLSDSLSSILSIVSSVLAGVRPTKKHPMGYGRIKYLFSIRITLIIMILGLHAMIEAFDGIFNPHEAPSYNTATLVIISVSLVFKLSYGVMMPGGIILCFPKE